MRRELSGGRVKLLLVLLLLVLGAYLFRRLPWQGTSPMLSHFFVGHHSALQLTLESGHIPAAQSYPGIANFKTALLDQWFRLVFFSSVIEVLGLEGQRTELQFLQLFTHQPLLIGFASLLLVGRKHSNRIRAAVFIFPLFAGQIAIARSNHALYDWGYGAAFFIWAISGLVVGIRKDNAKWFLLTPVFGLLVLASRHTAGLILIFAICFIIIGSNALNFEHTKAITRTGVLTVIAFALADIFIFQYLANVLSWGVIEIGRFLLGQGFGGGAQTLTIDGTKRFVFSVANTLNIVDRILLSTLIAISVMVWVASTPMLQRICQTDFKIVKRAEYESLGITIFVLLSLSMTSITFFIFKGIPGVLGRGQQYVTLFGLLITPCLVSTLWNGLADSEAVSGVLTPKRVKRLTLALMLVLVMVSPAAYVTSDRTTTGSPWVTVGEEQSIRTLQTYVPTESRIAGSYHVVPPFVYSHPCLVGPHWREDPSAYSTEINGLYYRVNQSSSQAALDSLAAKYGSVNMVLIGERVTQDLGVHSKARNPGRAPNSIWADYRAIPGLSHVYSGKVHAYSTGKKSSCSETY